MASLEQRAGRFRIIFRFGGRKFQHTLKTDDARCTGGAGKFLTAITTEMIPKLAAKFPIDTAQLGLFGLSAGGFFASWAIFQPSSPFKNYLISSPAMAYGRGEIFRQEASYAANQKDLPVGIYLAAGTLEAADPQLEGIGEIVSGMSRIMSMLAIWPLFSFLTLPKLAGLTTTSLFGCGCACG